MPNHPLLLNGFRIDPARAADRFDRLPFLSLGSIEIRLQNPLTFLIGENGSGKTTVLEAIAARCAIRPSGGTSYTETQDDRAETALSAVTDVHWSGRRPRGLFLRADRFTETMAHAGRMPMPNTGEWRLAEEQSRGEAVLSLLTARIDASEQSLFILDEPETGLSPQRQMALLCLLDTIQRDGRSQAIVATHAPILMSHPHADLLWIDSNGIERRELAEIPHWREMRRFMRDPETTLRRLLD
jgi:predicted ATPase